MICWIQKKIGVVAGHRRARAHEPRRSAQAEFQRNAGAPRQQGGRGPAANVKNMLRRIDSVTDSGAASSIDSGKALSRIKNNAILLHSRRILLVFNSSSMNIDRKL